MRIHTLFLVLLVLFLTPVAQADLSRAQNLFEQGRANEAMAEVDRLLAESPGDAETRFLKGILYADMGRSQQAIEVFAGLTHDFPELPEPYNNLAVLFAEQGEFVLEPVVLGSQSQPCVGAIGRPASRIGRGVLSKRHHMEHGRANMLSPRPGK